jgi:glycosyltransferase involved in cell wall biosynthesis
MTSTQRLGVLATHPIQYHAPLYRALAECTDLRVYFAHRQTPQGQADAGFGVAFEWDVPLLDGYDHVFLENTAKEPDVSTFRGCSTPAISRIIEEERFDAFLVSGWYNRSYWQAIRACWRTGTPLFVRGDSQLRTPRSLAKRLAKEAVYRAFIPRFDAYLVVGARARAYYLHYGADPSRMFFAPHFVDNEFFAERASTLRPERADLREGYGLQPTSRVFLFAGKFTSVKRPLDFVEALAALSQRVPGVEGMMVGAGPLGPEVEAAIARTGAPVRTLGFFNQSDMPRAYAAADVLVLPSATETWGLVVNEAMACGLPAVVSDEVGCAPDLIEEGETGEVYSMGDVNALASAMERALLLISSHRVSQALAAKTAAYSLEVAAEGVVGALDRCLSGGSRTGNSSRAS